MRLAVNELQMETLIYGLGHLSVFVAIVFQEKPAPNYSSPRILMNTIDS